MESKINRNLQDMPQLVIAKIMKFLNHKQLLMLEQVSKTFKCYVEDHFRTTDHLTLGSLPSIRKLDENKKLLQLIQRCGITLRTIQFNVSDTSFFFYRQNYLDHLFEFGGEVISKTFPNIEHIIKSPKMDTEVTLFNGQVIGLSLAENYANHLYKMDDKCKLRAIRIFYETSDEIAEKKFEEILDCYPYLQHIYLSQWNNKLFLRYLPQLIKNGLKDLIIYGPSMDFQDAVEYCKSGTNLRTLRFAVEFESDDEIASINRLKLPKGLELEMLETNASFLSLLNENVCDRVVKMVCPHDDTSDCSSMIKLKNLREFHVGNLKHVKLIAKESFPELKEVYLNIRCNPCTEAMTLGYGKSVCESIFLPQLLISKGHQLADIGMLVCGSLDLVVKAVKHCKAALYVDLSCSVYSDPCTTSITIEDFMAILELPRLQKFNITHIVSASSDIDDLQQKMKIAENAQTNFKFQFNEENGLRIFSFERIDI